MRTRSSSSPLKSNCIRTVGSAGPKMRSSNSPTSWAATWRTAFFAWRDYSRPRIKRALGIAGTRMSRTQRHVLYLVRGILDRADELASFVAHIAGAGPHRPVGGRRPPRNSMQPRSKEIRRLHADMIADLSAWADARNWIVGLARERPLPRRRGLSRFATEIEPQIRRTPDPHHRLDRGWRNAAAMQLSEVPGRDACC